MAAIALNQLNLLSLPAVDVLRGGWAAVEKLPSEPGCYAVMVTLAPRLNPVVMTASDRTRHSKALVWALGRANAVKVSEAISRGNGAVVSLYVGYSKSLVKRWAGSTPHHKEADLRAVVYLLGLFFDVRSLNIHYLLTRDGDSAKMIESYLIKLWQPALNNRAPIVNVTTGAAA